MCRLFLPWRQIFLFMHTHTPMHMYCPHVSTKPFLGVSPLPLLLVTSFGCGIVYPLLKCSPSPFLWIAQFMPTNYPTLCEWP